MTNLCYIGIQAVSFPADANARRKQRLVAHAGISIVEWLFLQSAAIYTFYISQSEG